MQRKKNFLETLLGMFFEQTVGDPFQALRSEVQDVKESGIVWIGRRSFVEFPQRRLHRRQRTPEIVSDLGGKMADGNYSGLFLFFSLYFFKCRSHKLHFPN